MHDKCPEVADAAKEVYNVCFPHAERNAMKKQLVINTLSFEVHTEVYDGCGDMEMADCLFTVDRKSRVLTMMDFQAGSVVQSVTLEGGQMAKLLRYVVHTLEIQLPKEPEGSPSWRAKVEYTNYTKQDISSYHEYLPERPEELYFSLLEYFEPEEEDL